MNSFKGQLTLRGLIIGCAGSALISASSLYIALKMGALPWPIMLTALLSFFLLKAFGHTNLNEVNVTHTAMSAGAMVAGGLAFTIPGLWILDAGANIPLWQIIVIALCGTALGLVFTLNARKRFIDEENLDYPIGASTGQALLAAESGGKRARQLFTATGISGLYAFARDGLALLPSVFLTNVSVPGVAFGLYNSPMLLAVGLLITVSASVVWIIGALFGNFGIVVAGSAFGLWSVADGQGIRTSLGIGCMFGCGLGVLIKSAISYFRASKTRGKATSSRRTTISLALALAAVVLIDCFALQVGPLASVILVVLTWLAVTMSSQSVGETGINPMEVFGAMVLIACAALCELPQMQLFAIAAIAAVACGLVGDVMNDYKAGAMLGTDARAQWVAELAGAMVGAIVAAVVLFMLVQAYGTGSFGSGQMFVAAQAEVVATMISGIPSIPAFAIGLIACTVLFLLRAPVLTLGIGIYLPFYMSFTVVFGLIAKLLFKRFVPDENTGLCIASGVLGGESIVGVLCALAVVLFP